MRASTVLLTRNDIVELLDMPACIEAVESAFRLHAEGKITPGILGMHVEPGSFHIKAAAMLGARPYFAAKANANFPANPATNGLPTIQGAVFLFDAWNGCLLAIMDSAEVTALRTAATTAVAAKYLAKCSAATLTLVGCGAQARAHLRAIAAVRPLRMVRVCDIDPERAASFAIEHSGRFDFAVEPVTDLAKAVSESDMCVTCTPSRRYIIEREWVRPGSFVAGVGADNEQKQEIDPLLFRISRVVVDSLEQCATIGDLHHALDQNTITRAQVHAELSEIVAGRKAARRTGTETFLFDSSGVALGDVAAAAQVYERARERERGTLLNFTD